MGVLRVQFKAYVLSSRLNSRSLLEFDEVTPQIHESSEVHTEV
jgi:hypothetical protein